MTSPDYKQTELQDNYNYNYEEETLLLITRGAAGPKRQLVKDYYNYTVHLPVDRKR